MPKVFMHVRERPGAPWDNSSREFLRLPVPGEYVATASDSPWYRVDVVVHVPFEATYAAEVYATRAERPPELRAG